MMELKRSECAILPLVLKRRWYDMIDRGEKREEYRADTEYWKERLYNWSRKPGVHVVEFRLGYAKDAPRMAFWVFGCETTSGLKPYAWKPEPMGFYVHPEWGESKDSHFIIKLGERVTLTEGGK